MFIGSAHCRLLVDTAATLEPIFAQGDRLIAFHAEDRARIVSLEEKAKGHPNTPSGMPGVETSLPIEKGEIRSAIKGKSLRFE